MESTSWKSSFSVTVVRHFYLLSRRVTLTLSRRHDEPPSEENVVLPTQSSDVTHEFYQKPEEVVVSIFAKGIAANHVSINYGEQIISVTIDVPGEDSYIFQPRFFWKIVPARCGFEVLSTKVEIWLAKAEPIQ
ncbi:unnamed protein product [Lactuca saligna]|uniref:CS domain-containing protein n=1 Tax=Lactuca saligna TaxID=75948 RepID=A0AA35YA93_LACSI|nr:unnamed protein product [Lactuca saligna]